MTETEKHLKREKRIKTATDIYHTEKNKLETILNNATKKDKLAERELLSRCSKYHNGIAR